jgi:hypothetical protein
MTEAQDQGGEGRMAKFKTVVKRSEWLRGNGGGRLLNDEGMKCCLGFRCEQAGIPLDNLRGKQLPYEVKGKSKLPWWLRSVNLEGKASQAAIANDAHSLTDEEREAEITEIFKNQGEEIEFID